MFVFATPGDVASWRDQLSIVLNDPAGRSQRAEAARARVAQRYGIDVVVEAYLRLYQTVRTAGGRPS
jgi:glycosyltransferase involved in cell wall biosynthesis